VPLADVVAIACRHVGAPEPRVRIPTPIAHAGASMLEAAFTAARSRTPPPLTRYMLHLFGRGYVLSTEKAQRLLGWEPSVHTREGLAQACEALA
jgi:nucleoside-diphosphate-sugar epimerase